MTISDKLDLFFKKPTISFGRAGIVDTNPDFTGSAGKLYSTLYLLRRDVKRCFKASEPIYWPSTMAVFAGIDLLAKLSTGTDVGPIGTKFQNFVQQFMSLGDSLKMWPLRNSLMHSFGVDFHEPVSTTGSDSSPRRFRLNAIDVPPGGTYSTLFAIVTADVVEVNIKQIREAFEMRINTYECVIRSTISEQTSHFEPMYDKYGWICESPAPCTIALTTFVPLASGG